MRRDNGSDRNPGKIAHSLDSGGRSGAPVKVTLIYRAVVATRPRCLSAQYPQSLGPRLGVFYVSLWEPRALSIAGRPGDHRALRAVLSRDIKETGDGAAVLVDHRARAPSREVDEPL